MMYWSAGTEETFTAHSAFEDTEHLNLCYLGFVNNIIDLDTMETLFQALHARTAVRLHLIAQGQRRDEMVERLSRTVKSSITEPSMIQSRNSRFLMPARLASTL
ncbi:hypothetical protein [Allobaculum sp. Allo2]|uniref:hypothetical protein n=1 Tax=Allobaculum sp. Allo2 TaxID=2853432 RepID=UPI001F6067CA|nr:hypothetical protein [Allobaculum sp. Allo2]UNT93033.1 hypothetical protein KWG61_13480 [Allobaculum sp. Allo2]